MRTPMQSQRILSAAPCCWWRSVLIMLIMVIVLMMGSMTTKTTGFLLPNPRHQTQNQGSSIHPTKMTPTKPFALTTTTTTTTQRMPLLLLHMSSVHSSSGTMSSQGRRKRKVLFEKTLRPLAKDVDSLEFLSRLIQYLEQVFELPKKELSMTYERIELLQHDLDQNIVVAFDSPLSGSAIDTRLNIEVVGVYTNQEDSIPSMAMVVVRKDIVEDNAGSSSVAPMMKSLFDDCEKKILKHLDQGLTKFVRGRVKMPPSPFDNKAPPPPAPSSSSTTYSGRPPATTISSQQQQQQQQDYSSERQEVYDDTTTTSSSSTNNNMGISDILQQDNTEAKLASEEMVKNMMTSHDDFIDFDTNTVQVGDTSTTSGNNKNDDVIDVTALQDPETFPLEPEPDDDHLFIRQVKAELKSNNVIMAGDGINPEMEEEEKWKRMVVHNEDDVPIIKTPKTFSSIETKASATDSPTSSSTTTSTATTTNKQDEFAIQAAKTKIQKEKEEKQKKQREEIQAAVERNLKKKKKEEEEQLAKENKKESTTLLDVNDPNFAIEAAKQLKKEKEEQQKKQRREETLKKEEEEEKLAKAKQQESSLNVDDPNFAIEAAKQLAKKKTSSSSPTTKNDNDDDDYVLHVPEDEDPEKEIAMEKERKEKEELKRFKVISKAKEYKKQREQDLLRKWQKQSQMYGSSFSKAKGGGESSQHKKKMKKTKTKVKLSSSTTASTTTTPTSPSSRRGVKGTKATPPNMGGTSPDGRPKKKIHIVDASNVINKKEEESTNVIEPELVESKKRRLKEPKMSTRHRNALDATVVVDVVGQDDESITEASIAGSADTKKPSLQRNDDFDISSNAVKDNVVVEDDVEKEPIIQSKPKDFDISNEAIRKKREDNEKLGLDDDDDNDVVAKTTQQQEEPRVVVESTPKYDEEEEEEEQIPHVETNRDVNMNVVLGDELKVGSLNSHTNISSLLEKNSNFTTNMTKEERARLEREDAMVQSGQDAMDEMIEKHGEDMTAEDLLRSVLKFDEEKKKEEAVGSGFVSGAMEKAKELLRERQAQYNEKKTREAERLSSPLPNIGTYDPDEAAKLAAMDESELTMEQKLRKMFQAGEQAAESRIQEKEKTMEDPLPSAGGFGLTPEQKQVVDELVAQEKDISDYAKTIDEELVELEMRINRSPDEELDGPKRFPFHDAMSGPEVYDPNVDPETAVNWPGAPQRDKAGKIRLPKELAEAVKHAQFAASVLLRIRQVEVEGEEEDEEKQFKYFLGKKELSRERVIFFQDVAMEAVSIGIIEDPLKYMEERARLNILVTELWHQPEERFRPIAENYKDLFLSDNFVPLVKDRMGKMADRDRKAHNINGSIPEIEIEHERERELLGQMVNYTQLLLKETQAFGAQLEAQQIDIIRSICEVAMDPKYTTEEECAMALTDAVRDMRPLFDDAFIAYLKYAILEEEGRLARAGQLDDPRHNQWWMILKIVQQGVHKEVAKSINRLVDHLFYVLRMHTRKERRRFLELLIDDMPTMDVRPFVLLVENIVGSLGDVVKGEFTGDDYELGRMTNKLLQMKRDVEELLPPERVDRMAKDADEWAERQRAKIKEARQFSQERMAACREIDEDLKSKDVQELLNQRPSGEVESFSGYD